LKILYLHQYFNTPDMSGGTRSYEMARRLVKMGHEVHMITSWREESDNKTWYETEVEGIHIHWLPITYSNRMSYAERIKAFFKFALFSAIKTASLEGDVVFATSTPLTIALPAVYSSRKLKIPMVFEVRDLWPELPIAMGALKNPIMKFFAQKLENFAYKNSSSIIALSPGMRDGVVATGYHKEKVAVIPNSSDVKLFDVDSSLVEDFRSKREWLMDRPLLVYAGTFGLINGVGYMVNMARCLLQDSSNIRILLIGDGFEFEKVQLLAKEAGVLNKNLFIERQIPKKDIPVAFNAATVSLSLFIDKPEMWANSANKFFDGLAAKKPILINYGGWQKELLEKHKAGISIWGLSDEDAAQKISEVIHDAKWLEMAGEASYKMALELFNRDVLALQFESVLVNTVNSNTNKSFTIAPGEY
jgi:glycosyltransferase involved in cell wall biosynthesis